VTARVLDGRGLASHLRRDLQARVERISGTGDAADAPCLAILADGTSEAASL
jgi:hypothetical protein